MIRYVLLSLCTLLLCLSNAYAVNVDAMKALPIQHDGRVKPFDSFARHVLRVLSGKDELAERSAVDQVVRIMFQTEDAIEQRIVLLDHPQLRAMFELPKRSDKLYSYREISHALSAQSTVLPEILLKQQQQLPMGPVEHALVDIYEKYSLFTDILGSMSVLLPYHIKDDEILEILEISSSETLITYERLKEALAKQKKSLMRSISVEDMAGENVSSLQRQLIALAFSLQQVEQDKHSRIIRVLPEPWLGEKEENLRQWYAPWGVLEEGKGSPATKALMQQWTSLILAYQQGEQSRFDTILAEITSEVRPYIASDVAVRFELELMYNRWHLGRVTLLLALLSSIALLIYGLSGRVIFLRGAAALFYLNFVILTVMISLRMYILLRPPVSTLYESVLFVAWCVMFMAILLIRKGQLSLALVMGSVLTGLLLLVARGYEKQGETMQTLIAVLDTNFWLATHVVTITIGYACSLVVSLLAHYYLIERAIGKSGYELNNSFKLIRNNVNIAVLFTVIGTILGGVWADQSWGRFWGWDPKENGAMLLAMWLILVMHGYHAKCYQAFGYVAMCAATSIIVMISWFGVNLLNVGLHSYGFTDGIALNMLLFVIAELIFTIAVMIKIKRQTPVKH